MWVKICHVLFTCKTGVPRFRASSQVVIGSKWGVDLEKCPGPCVWKTVLLTLLDNACVIGTYKKTLNEEFCSFIELVYWQKPWMSSIKSLP